MTTSTLEKLIQSNHLKKIEDFSADGKLMFNLIALIVNIKYRQKEMKSFDYNKNNHYSENASSNNVLADKIPPVDDGLLGHRSTGDIL